MSSSTSYNREIIEILSDLFPLSSVNDIHPDASLSDRIGLDSLSFVQLVVAIEEKFNILIENDYILYENFSTINEINRTVNELVQGAPGSYGK